MFGKYLLVTNTVSSGGLMMLGDVVAQELEKRRHGTAHTQPGYDWYRIGKSL